MRTAEDLEQEVLSLRDANRSLTTLVEKQNVETGIVREYFAETERVADGGPGSRLLVLFARARSLFFK